MASFGQKRLDMVARQIAARGIVGASLLAALRSVPREFFIPPDLRFRAYDDGPLPIGEEQTISQPYIVALMIEAAHIASDARVLEIGAGSGYAAALLSRMAQQVYAIERHEVLAHSARQRIERLGYRNCTIISGDGRNGLVEESPFDAILISARCEQIPGALKCQLAIGGTLVAPVGNARAQSLIALLRTGKEQWTSRNLGGARFVPLLPGTVRAEEAERPDEA